MSEPRLKSVLCSSPAGLHRMAYKEWGDPDNPQVLVCVHGVTRVADVFDGGADFAHQFLDGFTDVRVDCARDVVAAHRHKSSRCCNL